MKVLPLILIAGWGYTGEAMLRLKEALDGHPMDGYPIQVTSTGELWQTQSSGALPHSPGLSPFFARKPCGLPQGESSVAPKELWQDKMAFIASQGSAKDSTCVVPADGRSRLPHGFLRRQGYAGQVPRGASRYALGLHNLLATFGGRVGVIGWSMGGIVALETAREYPGLLQRLVIISGTARFSAGNDALPALSSVEGPGVSASVLRAMALGLRRTPNNVLVAYYAKVHAPQGVPTTAAITRAQDIALLDRDELLQGLDYLQRMDLRDGLDKQTVPTLVVHGREDRIVPWQAGEWLSRALAVSHWRCHESLGHALPIQAPSLLAADIRAFLA